MLSKLIYFYESFLNYFRKCPKKLDPTYIKIGKKRFIVDQPTNSNACGPIAIMNLIEDMGGRLEYKYLDLFTGFEYTNDAGMPIDNISKILNLFGIKHKVIDNISYDDLMKYVKRKKKIIFCYMSYSFSGNISAYNMTGIYHCTYLGKLNKNQSIMIYNNLPFEKGLNDLKLDMERSVMDRVGSPTAFIID